MSNKCEKCKKIFPDASKLKKHLERKTPCVGDVSSFEFSSSESSGCETTVSTAAPTNRTCHICHKTFTTVQRYETHQNRKYPCTIKTPHERELFKLYLKLQHEHEELKATQDECKTAIELQQQQIDTLKKGAKKGGEGNDDPTQSIVIVGYGKENMDHITDPMYKKCFRQRHKSVEKLFELKHLSKLRPENHNIFIPNIQQPYVMLYNGVRWELVNKAPLLEKMYYNLKDILSSVLDRLRTENQIDDKLVDIFSPFVDDPIDEKYEEKIKRASCDEIVCMAYNHRRIPMKHRAALEKKETTLNT